MGGTQLTDLERMAVLTEEVGEVAHALNEQDPDELRRELLQVAACAVAWLERIDTPEFGDPDVHCCSEHECGYANLTAAGLHCSCFRKALFAPCLKTGT